MTQRMANTSIPAGAEPGESFSAFCERQDRRVQRNLSQIVIRVATRRRDDREPGNWPRADLSLRVLSGLPATAFDMGLSAQGRIGYPTLAELDGDESADD